MTMARLNESIAGIAAAIPGAGKLLEQRSAALEAFRQQGIPGRSSEKWRYTDLSRLDNSDLSFTSPSSQSSSPAVEKLLTDGERLVIVDGVPSETLSRITPSDSIEISLFGSEWDALQEGFPGFEDVIRHPLGCLNTATTQHGIVVRTTPDSVIENRLTIVVAYAGEARLALQPRIVLDLRANSHLSVLLHYVSLGDAQAWTNAVIEVRQAPGSSLDLIQLQEQSHAHTHTALVSARLDAGASAKIGCFDIGASLARNDIDVRLSGSGARASVFGAILPMTSQHVDTQVSIDHQSADTQSETVFRGIAGAKSRGVFNGKVTVRQNAQRISAEQRSDNLLLAPDAEIDTKPELEIYADDVRCSHGATIGELDEEHLFYLKSRGIDDTAARALLTWAFAQTVVDRIEDPELRRMIGERISQRLPEHERWEQLI